MKTLFALLAATLSLGLTTTRADEMIRDVAYGHAPDGAPLLLDVHIPEGNGPFPVAILIHGGGWSAGDKSGSDKPGNSADIAPWFTALNAAHFTWFSINYRFAPQHPWPAGFDDVQTAIRWVKAHAGDYKGDPGRIALFGHSAGGHLACLAGTLDDASVRVQAVVGFAPVTDLKADVVQRHGMSKSLQNLFHVAPKVTPAVRAMLRAASPIDHVRPGLPPFLLLHGDADVTVAYAQSVAFQSRLRAAGVTCDLITIPGGVHRLLGWTKLAPDYPAQMTAWLHRALNPASTSP